MYLLQPGAEIPILQALAQPGFTGSAELGQQVADVALDRLGRDAQAGGDLAVGEILADERRHLLLARREHLPAAQVGLRPLAARQRLAQQFGSHLLSRALLAPGQQLDRLQQPPLGGQRVVVAEGVKNPIQKRHAINSFDCIIIEHMFYVKDRSTKLCYMYV
jgi:hypothetical protein